MLEQYQYTGKHRKSNDSLVPIHQVIAQSKKEENAPLAFSHAQNEIAYSAVEDSEPLPHSNDGTSIPTLHRPLTIDERVDTAPNPDIAFREILSDTSGDPDRIIKNIDLALKHFGADQFTDNEKALLSNIIIKNSEEIIHKSEKDLPAYDFTDPIILGSAVDILRELEADAADVDTEPILEGIVTIVKNISDASKNADHVAKLTTEEASALIEAINEFKRIPTRHHEKIIDLFDDKLRRITETKITFHELKYDHTKKKPLSLEDIRHSVDTYHDRKLLRRRRAIGVAAGNLVNTAAQPIVREKITV